MSGDEATEENEKGKKRKGCLGWLWRVSLVGILVLCGFLVWLNGPGMRWLGPKIATHFIESAGMEGGLRLGGTLLGGVHIYDLEITGAEGTIERLVVDRLETDYRFRELIKGEVRSVSGRGVHVDMRLVEKEKEETQPIDFAKLGKTLNTVREKILGLNVDLQGVSFSLKKDDKLIVGLDDSQLSHAVGSEDLVLGIGKVTDATGRSLEPQDTTIVWDQGRLLIDKLDLLPIVGVRELELLLPEDGEIAANANLRLDGAVLKLDIGRGIQDVRLDLTEGAVDFVNVTEALGIELPLSGRLTSLAIQLEKIYPEWQTAVGAAEMLLEEVSYDGWDVSDAAIRGELKDGTFGAKIAGSAFGSKFSIDGNGAFERALLESDGFVTEGVKGNLQVEKLGEVLRALGAKLDLGGRFSAFPESDLAGTWTLDLRGGTFAGVGADVVVKAKEAEASPIRLDALFAGKIVTVKALEIDGNQLSGFFDTETQEYELSDSMADFHTDSIVSWLDGVGVELPGSGQISLNWEGKGNLRSNQHAGQVRDFSGKWNWKQVEGEPSRAPISAASSIDYNWPESVTLEGLKMETEGQAITLDAKLAENSLELEKFVWLDGTEEIASGEGRLPMPEDFANFKEFIANDNRPVDLKIHSKTLSLTKFQPWVKGLDQIGGKATGKLDIVIAGSLAEPEVDALLELRGINVPDRAELPETDVTLKLDAGDGIAKITGEATAPDYAPATLDLKMPFLPKQWVDEPGSMKNAPLSGKLDLPRIDLARFQALVPGAKNLAGIAEGKIVVKGTVGDPDVSGDLKLTGGKLVFENESLPALDGMTLDVGTDLQEVTLKGGIQRLEGGFLDFDGSMALKQSGARKVGDLDLKVSANGLPVVRNDFLIIRANADLRVRGGIADAELTGELGIVDSMFYKDMELIPIGKPFLEPSPAKLPGFTAKTGSDSLVPAPFGGWTANVVVKTIDPILIRGNLGRGAVDVALRIEGKLADPKPNGTVRLRDAVVRLPFSTLAVKQGTLTFSPATGLDPIVELRGSAEPRPYNVDVYAYGRMSDPQLVLTSQPPLPENEIMTLLATGTTSAGLEDSQAASSRALQLLIEELRRGRFLFGKQLRPVLGLLDNVDFSLSEGDPYDSETYNSARLKLSDKWFISAGVGSTGEQRVMAIYRLRFK